MKTKFKILHLEDTPADAELVERELKKGKIQFEKLVVGNKTAFEKALKEFAPDIIISDHTLPSFDSKEAINIIKQKGIKIPFILVTATVSDEYAVEIMKAGADDYILKDRLHRLPQAVLNAMEKNMFELELQLAHEKMVYANRMYSFISHVSQTIVHVKEEQQVFKEVCRIAIEFGKFKAAWIGLIDTVNQKINLVQGRGILPKDLWLFKNVTYTDNGPQYYVLQTDNYYICNNVQQDLELENWKLFAAEAGFNAVMVLPIRKSGIIIGTFNLYAAEINFFNEGEISLLAEAAGDISFALEVFEKDKQRTRAESNLQTIFENASEGFILADTNGIVKTFNTKTAQTILLNTEQEIKIGSNIYDFIHPSQTESYEGVVSKVLAGETMQYDYSFERKNGDTKWFSFTINPAYDKARQIEGICITSADITQRKKAEEERNMFFDLSVDMMGITGDDGHFNRVNPSFEKTLGYTPTEFYAKPFLEFVHPDDIPSTIHEVEKLAKGVSTISFTNRYRCKDGNYKWLEWSAEPVGRTLYCTARDITERKKAAQALSQSEFRYRQFVETAQEGIWMLDENNLTTFANKKLGEILEYSPQEMMGKENYLFMDDAGKKALKESLERVRKGIKESVDMRYITKGGKHIWATVSANPVFDETGKYKGALGMVADITLRKEAEQKLHESETFNKGVLSSLSSHIAVIDECGTLIAVNKAWNDFAKANGITSHERVSAGSNYFDVCKRAIENGDSFAAQVLAGIQSVFKKETQQFEMEYPCHSAEQQRWFILSAINFGSDAHKVVISHQNITVRKQAEQSLQQSQSNLKAIIENTDATIYSLDTEFRYMAFNQPLYNYLKQIYGLEIKLGDHVFSYLEKLEPEEAKGWKEIYSKALKGETVKFEKEFSVGEFHNYSSFSIYPVWENKIIIGLSCFVYDITKQKQEQQQKEKMSADLIQRNRDLEQFTFIISHNLRAPTANIIGFTENLQEETLTPREQKEFLQGLSTSATGLDTIIKDINTILQIKREVNEKKEIVIFSKLVNEIMISIGNLIDKHRVLIKPDFSQVNEFYSLKVYMYSIFYNLISNSIKYSKPNEQPLIEIKSKKENGKIILTFNDNGLGMDLKTKSDKIFGLYKRFHSHVEGKGMGLFMVKTQVESLGGKITIASELNKGTKFTIVFGK